MSVNLKNLNIRTPLTRDVIMFVNVNLTREFIFRVWLARVFITAAAIVLNCQIDLRVVRQKGGDDAGS